MHCNATDWLKCFCMYRLKCSKATGRGMLWMDLWTPLRAPPVLMILMATSYWILCSARCRGRFFSFSVYEPQKWDKIGGTHSQNNFVQSPKDFCNLHGLSLFVRIFALILLFLHVPVLAVSIKCFSNTESGYVKKHCQRHNGPRVLPL